ncbi:alpha/beta hydrolase family protein [Maribacter sp. 2307ULW6-5]|uniref:alpha/beta hydrolase family protein n=1 Tax=Maribacter sp. 2307ULW6-5 TaxID=3386275 RepID=UPI0039BCE395
MLRYTFLMLMTLFHATILGQTGVYTEEMELKNGAIALPGTLSLPNTDLPVPLAILVHGSGNVDRNGNQGPMVQGNYLKMLSDALNAAGIACYRYDKRTAHLPNAPQLKGTLLKDFVADVQVAIKHFMEDGRFNGIHLVGHSQGSLVGMLAVNEQLRSFTSVAGSARPIGEIITEQVTKQDSTLGRVTAAHVKELKETDTLLKVSPYLMNLFAPQNQHFLRNWMAYDPKEVIANLKVPVLLVHGEEDLQVTPGEAKALQNALPAAKLVLVPKMNHVLKSIENMEDNLKSYRDSNFELSNDLVKALSAFIKTHE